MTPTFRDAIRDLVGKDILVCGKCHARFHSYDEFKTIDLDANKIIYHCDGCGHNGFVAFSEIYDKCNRIHHLVLFSSCRVGSDDKDMPYAILKDGNSVNGTFSTCKTCGRRIRGENARKYGEFMYCVKCFDIKFFACVLCGRYFPRGNAFRTRDGAACESCWSDHYTPCPACGEASYVDSFHGAHDDNGDPMLVCDTCWRNHYQSLESWRTVPGIQFRHDDDLDRIVDDPGSEA